ncbi:MAG: hypothetical protein ACMZ7B_07060 [Balneola sp.]
MDNSFYNPSEQPTSEEKEVMWKSISQRLDSPKVPTILNLHWRSFWVGNAAAILLGFALIGIYSAGSFFLNSAQQKDSDQQVYETLNTATNKLRELPPLLIDQATEPNKSSLESTALAIEGIDRLIDEIKEDMLINGETPVKRSNLKRLYATKLDFYKELLLNEDTQS